MALNKGLLLAEAFLIHTSLPLEEHTTHLKIMCNISKHCPDSCLIIQLAAGLCI